MNKLSLLIIFMLFCGALFSQSSTDPAAYRFIVLGDRNGGARPGIFPAVIAKTLSLSPAPAFYINVGDLIKGYTSDTTALIRQWEEVKSELKPVTDKYAFHYVPGNHDITDSLQLPLYRRYAGNTYYSFDVGPDHFVVLDNSRGDGLLAPPTEQLKWLKQDLAVAKKARYTFCFYHMPCWKLEPKEKSLDSLHHLFKEGGVDYVINGHYHNYQYGERDGVKYVVLGSSGGAADLVKSTGSVYQFLVADIGRDKINLRPFLLDGDTMRIDWIGKSKLSLLEALKAPFWTFDPRSKTCALSITTANLVSQPLSVRYFWDVPASCGWVISPDTLAGRVAVSGEKVFTFSAKTETPLACAVLHVEYRWPGDSILDHVTPGVKRRIPLARADGKVAIDGELTEKTWASLLNNPEYGFGNGDTASDSTWIGLAFDKDNLYLAYRCWEKGMATMTTLSSAETRDILSPKETQIRFYLGYKTENDTFFQIQMNIPGSLLDMKATADGASFSNDKSWNGVSAWKVKVTTDQWQGEIAVPWKELGLTRPEALRFNCRRTSVRETAYQEPYERNPKRFAIGVLGK